MAFSAGLAAGLVLKLATGLSGELVGFVFADVGAAVAVAAGRPGDAGVTAGCTLGVADAGWLSFRESDLVEAGGEVGDEAEVEGEVEDTSWGAEA